MGCLCDGAGQRDATEMNALALVHKQAGPENTIHFQFLSAFQRYLGQASFKAPGEGEGGHPRIISRLFAGFGATLHSFRLKPSVGSWPELLFS